MLRSQRFQVEPHRRVLQGTMGGTRREGDPGCGELGCELLQSASTLWEAEAVRSDGQKAMDASDFKDGSPEMI